MDEWFYTQNGVQAGPVSWQALQELVATGQVQAVEHVWKTGMAQWTPVASLPALAVGPVTPQAWPSAYAAPVPLDYSAHRIAYGGFWLRFCASFIDGLVMIAASMPINFMIRSAMAGLSPNDMQMVQMLIGALIGWLYFALQESSEAQATLGKRALSLRVTTLAGQRQTFAQASGRHFAKYLSMLTLCFGYLMAGFTERKQALHDMVAGALVIRTGL